MRYIYKYVLGIGAGYVMAFAAHLMGASELIQGALIGIAIATAGHSE